MSDDEYNTESDSENSVSSEEIQSIPHKKPLVVNINNVDDSDVEVENSDSDSDSSIAAVSDDDTVVMDDSEEEDEDFVGGAVEGKKTNKPIPMVQPFIIEDNEDDDEDEFDENYLQKFNNETTHDYVNDFHPECFSHNYDEIACLSIIVKNHDGIIVDPIHKTIPFLTKYEKARVLGQRSKQLETGAKPLVKIPENIIDSYIIAELELKEKKIPFIIRRPIPGGGCEYWKLCDLENISF